jgi:hypothetical protein
VHHVGPAGGGDAALRLLADERVQQALERLPRRRVGEDALAHPFAVHRAGLADHVLSEESLHFRDGGAARLGELVRDRVGVDHGCAEARELLRGGALAAADAPRQADDKLHSLCRYQRTSASPQYSATIPATAR